MAGYLVADEWTHIFDDRRGEEFVRFAFDCDAGEIVAMDYRASANREWSPADPATVADVMQGLRDNYDLDAASFGSGGMQDPAEYGIELADTLPAWAVPAAPRP